MGQSELKTIELPDERSCVAAGKKLVAAIVNHLPEDRAFIVHLSGELGAGKTTFARGMLRGAGVEGHIRSPTYTLVETYDTPAAQFVHIDLYRISDAADAEGLGLREYDRPGVIWLVEWPERVVLGPVVDIRIGLSYPTAGEATGETGRRLSLSGRSPSGQAAVGSLAL